MHGHHTRLGFYDCQTCNLAVGYYCIWYWRWRERWGGRYTDNVKLIVKESWVWRLMDSLLRYSDDYIVCCVMRYFGMCENFLMLRERKTALDLDNNIKYIRAWLVSTENQYIIGYFNTIIWARGIHTWKSIMYYP